MPCNSSARITGNGRGISAALRLTDTWLAANSPRAARQRAQAVHGHHRLRVDGVHMVRVVPHASGDTLQFGYQRE
jgi:hypothetical protein